jgi:threonine/homoserine/homoserine lactone efflux protein
MPIHKSRKFLHSIFMTAESSIFVKGIGAGLAIAAPVGPIGLLCIRRTITNCRRAGLVTGLGAATADFAYGLIAALGLTSLSYWLATANSWLHWAGAAFLLWIGVRTLMEKSATASVDAPARGLLPIFGTTFLLTIANPMTLVSFLGLIAGLGAISRGYLLAAGIFMGSVMWWLILTSLANCFRSRMGASGLLWVNRVAGLVLIGFALVSLR